MDKRVIKVLTVAMFCLMVSGPAFASAGNGYMRGHGNNGQHGNSGNHGNNGHHYGQTKNIHAPEPVSAVLFLLGGAGLGLKRFFSKKD